MGTTLTQLKTGRARIQQVLAIEGWPSLFTDGSTSAAVTAWSGTDWTQAQGGLFVQGQFSQAINPWQPFSEGGELTFHIHPDASDTFGIAVHRTDAGAESTLTTTLDPNGSTIEMRSTSTFAASGELHIGTECSGYTTVSDSTHITGLTRGKYSPFGTAIDNHFAHHHRVATYLNTAPLDPVVSQQDRTWIGRWVGLWIHRNSGGTLDTKAQAQCVWAGRITEVRDDPATGYTVVVAKHVLDVIRDAVLPKDQFSITPREGIYLQAGRKFGAKDVKQSPASSKTATDLVVVASGAAGANQINEGWYTNAELVSVLNSWLSSEFIATRLNGTYTFAIVNTDQGWRTQIRWRIDASNSSTPVNWRIDGPPFAWFFLGFFPTTGQAQTEIKANAYGDTDNSTFSESAPFVRLLASSGDSGSQEAFIIEAETTSGLFVPQAAMLPDEAAAYADSVDSGGDWGLFVIDGKFVIAEQTTATEFRHVHLLNSLNAGQQSNTTEGQFGVGVSNYGRRVGEDNPIDIHQVFVLSATFAQLITSIFASTGSSGYNDDGGGFDVLGAGLGLAIPYELMGAAGEFYESLSSLPNGLDPAQLIIDKPTKMIELLQGSLTLRRAHLVWKNGLITWTTWSTPTATLAVHTLDESNKGQPADTVENPRVSTTLDSSWMFNEVRVTYSRDFSSGSYKDTLVLQDATSIDDQGGQAKSFNLLARCENHTTVEALAAGFLAWFPFFSRPRSIMRRNTAPTLFEDVAPGDLCTVSDDHARDPTTGRRGISGRPGLIVATSIDWGGFAPGNPDQTSPPLGEMRILFLDVDRVVPYSYAAEVDDTASTGGFTAGYNSATHTLRCYASKYSAAADPNDATFFVAGDSIQVVEVDPDDPAAPISWQADVLSQSGDDITLTAALSAPAFDTSKKYRVIPYNYTHVTATQATRCFQADDTDGMIEDTRTPFQYGVSHNALPSLEVHTTLPERHAQLSYGDGKALDVGYERGLALMANNLIDHKCAYGMPIVENIIREGSAGYLLVYLFSIYVGPQASAQGRVLKVWPWTRSKSGVTSSCKVTVSPYPPIETPGNTALIGVTHQAPFNSFTWSGNTTAWDTFASSVEIDASIAGVTGVLWVSVECEAQNQTRGLRQLELSERRNT